MKSHQKIWNIVYRFNESTTEALILKPNPEPGRSTEFYVITGDIEPNEQPIDAAKRETFEEIGITPLHVTNLLRTISYTDKFSKIEFTEHCFAVKVGNSPLVLNEEHVDYKWVLLDDFADSIWWEGDKTELHEIVNAFRAIVS